MSHECDDCGQTFDTLSRLRLHDCAVGRSTEMTEPDLQDEESPAGPFADGFDRRELEREYPEVVGNVPEFFDGARDGEITALSRCLAEYEQALETVARGEAPGGTELHTDLQFAYYEPLADGLDTAVRRDGWGVLVEFIDAYTNDRDEFPEIGHVVANATGRAVVRTRRSEGVDEIPADALAFLGTIPEYVTDFHPAYEESYTYGWGIGHPDHSVADRLVELAEVERRFVKIALNTAFYVDQYDAVDVLERLVTVEDISTVTDRLGRRVDLTEFYFRAVADLETVEIFGPHVPPYWDGDDDLDRVVSVDPEVERRIRALADETGVVDGLPADWELHDLDRSLSGELLRNREA